jgi:transcription antitermination factor NusG
MGLQPIAMPAREPGELMRVGPFASFAATVIECDGISTTCWVSIFSRSCDVTLPWAAFEAA